MHTIFLLTRTHSTQGACRRHV